MNYLEAERVHDEQATLVVAAAATAFVAVQVSLGPPS
jgi:hypothetical protein